MNMWRLFNTLRRAPCDFGVCFLPWFSCVLSFWLVFSCRRHTAINYQQFDFVANGTFLKQAAPYTVISRST